jgi:hypothetical protein
VWNAAPLFETNGHPARPHDSCTPHTPWRPAPRTALPPRESWASIPTHPTPHTPRGGGGGGEREGDPPQGSTTRALRTPPHGGHYRSRETNGYAMAEPSCCSCVRLWWVLKEPKGPKWWAGWDTRRLCWRRLGGSRRRVRSCLTMRMRGRTTLPSSAGALHPTPYPGALHPTPHGVV